MSKKVHDNFYNESNKDIMKKLRFSGNTHSDKSICNTNGRWERDGFCMKVSGKILNSRQSVKTYHDQPNSTAIGENEPKKIYTRAIPSFS